MKAVEIKSFGAPEVLVLADRPDPKAGAGEVLVRVTASGVNRPDVLQRKGAYAPPPGASDLTGLEFAGEIVAGDAAAMQDAGLKLGDRVCALVAGGGYAQLAVAPVSQCLPVPKGLSDIEAGGLPETFFTVWINVFDRARLGRGETLLVQGGSSGIGVTAIQLARAFGHRVFATAGSPEKCAACEQLGAERGIDYRTQDFVEIVKELTAGKGVDVILDMVGGDYVPRELKCLATDGRLSIIAFLGGTRATLDMSDILFRRLTITGSTLRPRSVEYKAAVAQALRQRVWPLIEARAIRPVIYRTFPLA